MMPNSVPGQQWTQPSLPPASYSQHAWSAQQNGYPSYFPQSQPPFPMPSGPAGISSIPPSHHPQQPPLHQHHHQQQQQQQQQQPLHQHQQVNSSLGGHYGPQIPPMVRPSGHGAVQSATQPVPSVYPSPVMPPQSVPAAGLAPSLGPHTHNQFPSQQQSSAPSPPQYQQQLDRRAVNLLQERNVLPAVAADPPKIHLPPVFQHKDVNCSPDIFRCTLTAIPQTQELLKKARLPLGMVIHPFKDMKQLSVLQSSIIVRCRSCRTYINPFVIFTDQRHWKCNVCGRVNDLPEEFHFDPATKTYGEPGRRPEIKNATVEFIAPSEYMVRPPQPSAYMFILDVTITAVETGYLDEFCARMIENIDHIPGDHRAMIGFMAVDSQLHYFLLRENMPPKEFIVGDVEESFLPWDEGLMVKLHDNKQVIKQFLEQLPTIFAHNKETNFALGAALIAAHEMLSDIGGRVTVFQVSMTNLGPGALTSREDPNLRAAKEITNLGPANDFYKKLSLDSCSHQVAMDLFLLSSSYTDMATVSEMAKFCGGCVHYYPSLHAVRNPAELERFSGDLDRYLSRKVGWEAVLRIRCSKGLSLHTFHGHFFVRSTDLLALANVNPDSAFGVQVQMEENLYDCNTVTFQAALLYTSSKGERRIRVHTMCLPVTGSLADVQHGADVQTIVSVLAKMAVDRSVASSVSDAREALVNACVDAFGSYASSFAASQRVGALLAPDSLKLFPLYILGLLKHPAFTYGTSIKLDNRVFAMNSFKTLPHYYLIKQIYPDLYPLHVMEDPTVQPPLLQLSYEKIDRHGAYLMDTGSFMYIYICQAVSPTFCRNVFDAATFAHIDEDLGKLPELQNPQSEAIRKLVDNARSKRPFHAPLRIIREDSPSRELFVQRLVDDRSESTFSYVEFLQHLHKELNPR